MNVNFLKNKIFQIATLTLLIAVVFFFYNEKTPSAEKHGSDESNGLHIVILDVETIFREAKVFVDVQSQIEAKATKLQESASATQEKLQKKHKDLESQKTALSQSVFESKMQDLKEEFEQVSREAYKEKLSIDRAYKKSLKDIDDKFSEMITEYSEKNTVHLILNKSQTVYNDDNLEITEEVKNMLDSAMPSYSVTFEAVENLDS